VRYNVDGSLDGDFGTNGIVTTGFRSVGPEADSVDVAFGVAIQADGKIVAAGTHATTTENQEFALARYLKDGSLDPSFGHGVLVGGRRRR
jgi:uncharacterized delta-60 repeat protein